jgi:hypothetical protein
MDWLISRSMSYSRCFRMAIPTPRATPAYATCQAAEDRQELVSEVHDERGGQPGGGDSEPLHLLALDAPGTAEAQDYARRGREQADVENHENDHGERLHGAVG